MRGRMKSSEDQHPHASTFGEASFFEKIRKELEDCGRSSLENLEWLYENLHPYFFVTMREETEAVVNLAMALRRVPAHRRVTLVDQEKSLIAACLDTPGSLYGILRYLQEREISYAEITHSYGVIPGASRELEIQRFEFDRKSAEEIAKAGPAKIPGSIRKNVQDAMEKTYPQFDFRSFDRMLRLLWLNNRNYFLVSPAERVARVLWLYRQGQEHDGLFLDLEEVEQNSRHKEARLLFSVANPKQ
ncbi:MAG: amino acid dehydrogenase, partial [Pseudomonadota bacterium]